MTQEQMVLFAGVINELGVTEFYHGDCLGADKDAHDLVVTFGDIAIKKRPCDLESQRAWTLEGDCIAEPEPPLDRNRKLVDDGDTLVATPGEQQEELRSGTWATIRYAKRQQKPIIIIWPNGHVLR